MTPRVVGVDPSLTATAVASSQGWVTTISSRPRGKTIVDRARRLNALIIGIAGQVAADGTPDLVVMEGPGMAALSHGGPDLIGLWWLLADQLLRMELALAIAPPTCLKKYATGKGNASKDQVLAAAVRRYEDYAISDNNQADAVVLMAMGRCHLGWPPQPVPQINLLGLDKVEWPTPRGT